MLSVLIVPGLAPAADSTPVDEALRRMKVPPGFEVLLVAAEPDIVEPIAQGYDDRGRLWVLECPEDSSARIKILEDEDGDGRAERIRVFAKGLGPATALAIGQDGIFVGEAPRLLFFPDRDCDGVPDGPPEALLEGFGCDGAHDLFNSFTWGPDGWLYGCQGALARSEVRGMRFSAAVWRYHPRTRVFEIFAEGMSSPRGLDFDEHGQGFLMDGATRRLFHVVPGGLYVRQTGRNANPHAYGEIAAIREARESPDGPGDLRDLAPDVLRVGRAQEGLLAHLGDGFPPELQGRILYCNGLGNRLRCDRVERRGATYSRMHAPDVLAANDLRFRSTSLQIDPAGAATILDGRDERNSHHPETGSRDRSKGRVYRLVYRGPGVAGRKRVKAGDLRQCASAELARLLEHPNVWLQRTASRILAGRRDPGVYPLLREMVLENPVETARIHALWALDSSGGFDESFGAGLLSQGGEWVRSWTVRFLGDAGQVSGALLDRLAEMAEKDPSPEVRRQLASTCQRLEAAAAFPVAVRLALRDEDADDPVIPLLVWLALEPRVVPERERVVAWLEKNASRPLVGRHILFRAVRRLAAEGKPDALRAAVRLLRAPPPDSEACWLAAKGLLEELEGRIADVPDGWRETFAALRASKSIEVRSAAFRLAACFKAKDLLLEASSAAGDASLYLAERLSAVQALAGIGGPEALKALEALKPLASAWKSPDEESVGEAVVRALSRFEDAPLDRLVLEHWNELPPRARAAGIDALAGRRVWAESLLRAVEAKRVPKESIDLATASRIRDLGSEEVSRLLEEAWGTLGGAASQEIAERIARLIAVLRSRTGSFARGAEVFEKRCSKCHALYGKGHKVGPELDGAARHDIEHLVRSIVNPNDVVGSDHYATGILLEDGQFVQGILTGEDAENVTLRREQDALESYPRSTIRRIVPSRVSIMPEGLTSDMKDDEVRDLIAYVAASPCLSRVLVAGPFQGGSEGLVDINDRIEIDDLFETQLPPEATENPLLAAGVEWRSVDVGSWGEIDLLALGACGREDAAYLYAEARAPGEMRTVLQVGSHDAVKVWLNGDLVYRFGGRRKAVRDQDRVPITVRKGRNALLIKVVNRIPGESVLFVRLFDPERRLELEPAGEREGVRERRKG